MLSVLGMNLFLVILISSIFFELYHRVENHKQQQAKSYSLMVEARYLDEALTSAALMGAHDPDLRWQNQYSAYEQRLDIVIRELSNTYGRDLVEPTYSANLELIKYEQEGFKLAQRGQTVAAIALLEGPAYKTKKAEYLEGTRKLFSAIERIDVQAKNQYQNLSFLAGTIAFASLIANLFVLFFAFSRVQRQFSTLLEHFVQVARYTTIGQVAACKVHEIANSLSIIMGSLPLLEGALEQGLDWKVRLAAIEKASLRMETIISSTRGFSHNGHPQKKSRVPLSRMVTDALQFCDRKIRDKNVKIEVVVDPLIALNCNQVQIQQVLVNLLSNAIDAVASLEDRWIRVATRMDGPRLILTVTDSGTGIPEDVRRRLFHSFFTSKEIGQGTGVGLAICAHILSEHEATIRVNGESQNTAFEMSFTEFTQVSTDSEDRQTPEAA